jgi:hypothetical protein
MLFSKIYYKKAFVANLSHVTLAMLHFDSADFGSYLRLRSGTATTTATAAQRFDLPCDFGEFSCRET